MKCLLLCICLLAAQLQGVYAQEVDTSNTVNKTRLKAVTIGGAAIYGGSLIALNELWYANHPRSGFHFINDNGEWLQMDKAGHTFTAYYESLYGYKLMRWSGLPHKKALLYGGTWGILFQTPIEILDAFSADWGASAGDIAANLVGSGMFIAQELAWEEQKAQLKFSFTPTSYADIKPNLLGSALQEQLIKDYNGQTYWLSTGIYNFIGNENFPQWLNLAVGYGADGMLRGTASDQVNDPTIPFYERQRQFYLSFDVNLWKVNTRSKALNTIIHALAFIKVPSPTLEWPVNEKPKFHLIYF